MDAKKHNEFVRKIIMAHGRELIEQGDLAAQLVAVESLYAGLLAVVMKHGGKSLAEADGYISAVTHGARGRLPALMSPRTT